MFPLLVAVKSLFRPAVKPAIEANPLLIEVLQEDIDKGVSRATACPIALAMRRQGFESVHVSPLRAYSGSRCFTLPAAASEFVVKFDCQGAHRVKPFSFILEEGR
jgi:hypothetical protein